MTRDTDQLIEGMEWAAAHNLAELKVRVGTRFISIRRETTGDCRGNSQSQGIDAPAQSPAAHDPSILHSPMAGQCHLAQEPGAGVFVEPGELIEAGQTICLIEAMKVMVSIPADAGGIVEAVLVEDGAVIEVGTPLIRLRQ